MLAGPPGLLHLGGMRGILLGVLETTVDHRARQLATLLAAFGLHSPDPLARLLDPAVLPPPGSCPSYTRPWCFPACAF